MPKINENYLNLKESYLFSEIAHRVDVYKTNHPDKDVIRLGIGDVTLPLSKACVDALHDAADQMGKAETFKGYGPEKGYEFLRNGIPITIRETAWTLILTRSSSPTGPRVIPVTLQTCSVPEM